MARRNYASDKETKSPAFWMLKPPKTLFTCEKYQRVTEAVPEAEDHAEDEIDPD